MRRCPDCDATLKFSSEENEMVCEMCGYTSDSGPEELTTKQMFTLLSAHAQKHTLRNLYYQRPGGLHSRVARSPRGYATDTN